MRITYGDLAGYILEGMVMMTEIGDLLKRERLHRRLKQKDMVAGVMSTSFYSKVENGVSEINAIDLVKILNANDIDKGKFLSEVDVHLDRNHNSFGYLENRLTRDFYENNIPDVKKAVTEIKAIQPETPASRRLLLRSRLYLAMITDNYEMLSKKEKQSIRTMLFDLDTWDYTSVRIFANSLPIYDLGELSFLINALLKSVNNREDVDYRYQQAVADAILNFVTMCCDHQSPELTKLPLEYIQNLPDTPNFLFHKLLGAYCQAAIKRNKQDLKSILTAFRLAGWSADYLKRLDMVVHDLSK
ncbi:hypothetical protein HU830_08400 [Lactobacillus sp. DCY120]|uniref:HTH cro/C1-type domain-containing protein n=1 Tax=Bombilactobacillus apium TaxID=2675299 RepID=A0A850R450_9LACO|nr:Rgg/GadR/MutR family transcriptional regulator [Bombilactobacillus apium]NVY97140.1 hypothetical protein [Bombilactobacillus apium]